MEYHRDTSYMRNLDARDLIKKMIESIDDSDVNYGNNNGNKDLHNKMALEMARSAAINYGQKLSADEMEHIAGKLFALPDPSYTPNGNKIFHIIDNSFIQSLFR